MISPSSRVTVISSSSKSKSKLPKVDHVPIGKLRSASSGRDTCQCIGIDFDRVALIEASSLFLAVQPRLGITSNACDGQEPEEQMKAEWLSASVKFQMGCVDAVEPTDTVPALVGMCIAVLILVVFQKGCDDARQGPSAEPFSVWTQVGLPFCTFVAAFQATGLGTFRNSKQS